MCVSQRGSLWLSRYGGPKLSLSCVAKQAPPLPQSLALQTAYLHAPFEPREHPVLPELSFELCMRHKLWHMAAPSNLRATALLCSPLHTPPVLASSSHFSPSYPCPYIPRTSMDCHTSGHYRHERFLRILNLSMVWSESMALS